MTLDTRFWKKYFNQYDILNKLIPYDELLDRIVQLADIKDGYHILDAGSGTGNLSSRFKGDNLLITGVDYSMEGISLHKQKQPNAVLIQHDLTRPLPFTENSFDSIVSNNVLYTIPRNMRGHIFREFYRVLKPGGTIVIANLSDNFNPKNIYISHVKLYTKKCGFFKLVIHLLSLAIPTIKIFYYNYLINKENKSGQYDFFGPNEQLENLREAGFIDVFPTEFLYAGQSVLNKAIK